MVHIEIAECIKGFGMIIGGIFVFYILYIIFSGLANMSQKTYDGAVQSSNPNEPGYVRQQWNQIDESSNAVFAANGSEFMETHHGGFGWLDELMGIVLPKSQEQVMQEVGGGSWEQYDTHGKTIPDPPTLADGSIAGLRIVYLDDENCYRSPVMSSKWIDRRMGDAWAVNPAHPNSRKILETYAKFTWNTLHREPLQAVVSMDGQVQLLDTGAMKGNSEIVQVDQYYK